LGNRCASMASGLFQSIKNESGPHFATRLPGPFLVHTIKNALTVIKFNTNGLHTECKLQEIKQNFELGNLYY
jgi:hypothetical protein